MPLYEFSCKKCGTIFTELRKMGDDKSAKCPECGSDDTGRLISSFASASSARAGGSCAPSGGG